MNKIKKQIWKHNNRAVVRVYLAEYKATRKCAKCGESRSCCLVFHHRNPSSKKFIIAHSRDKAFSSIVAEVKKCDILCANCHLELHALEKLEMIEKLKVDEKFNENWLF